jgi:spore coat polysaccharide biosynthesis predicted glycosyltransferase SpsG
VIFASATESSGAGHVMRCASLAEAWKAQGLGDAVVVGTIRLEFARARLEQAGIASHPEPPAPNGRDILVVDSYDRETRERVAGYRDAAMRVFTDDLAEPVPTGFDVVWNPNGCGDPAWYSGFRGAVITGPHTVPLRPDLPRWTRSDENGIGVALGGGQPAGTLVAALATVRASMPGVKFSATGSWAPADWHRVQADNPWQELVRCRALIVVASATFWEASAVGIPLVVLRTQDNQRLVFEYAIERGLPSVNVEASGDATALGDVLADAIPKARPAPRISNGAQQVAQAIHRYAVNR